MSPPRIKICGLRAAEHALVAADAGADLLGFVFVEGVRRQLQPGQGRDVISAYRAARGPAGPKLVGLFRNQPGDRVNWSACRRCSEKMGFTRPAGFASNPPS